MSGEGWEKKLPPKTHNWFFVDSFCLSGFVHLVWGKWLPFQMWDHYINNNHNLFFNASLVDSVILQNYVSTDNEIKTTYIQCTTHQAFKIW